MVGKDRNDLVFTNQKGDVLRGNYRVRYFAPAVAECQKVDHRSPVVLYWLRRRRAWRCRRAPT